MPRRWRVYRRLRKASIFECFPYVCPEPVLGKWIFLVYHFKWRKRKERCVFLTCIQSVDKFPIVAATLACFATARNHNNLFSNCLLWSTRACLGKRPRRSSKRGAERGLFSVRTRGGVGEGWVLQETSSLFLSFSYVCPEPVLVK